MARRIETLFVSGPAGKLEALLEEPEHGEPRYAALVCHPHPLHGGTMHNKVVYRLARGLRHSGHVVLRFNFRGVNLSEGKYDSGVGEVEDARAALAELRGRYPSLPYTVSGFSFGSRVVLRLAQELPDAQRVIAAGFPAHLKDTDALRECGVLRTFIHSTHDTICPVDALQRFYDSLEGEKRLLWVEAKDHFFAGALEEFEGVVRSLEAPEAG